MASRYPTGKMNATYKCPDCGKKWKSKNSRGEPKQCDVCQKGFFEPYKYEPMEKKTKYVRETKKIWKGRQFGEFQCDCGREWKSANSWENKWQLCNDCGEEVYPEHLQPLKYQGGEGGKPHETENCEMCQELGYNCREYTTEEVEVVVDVVVSDDDDDDNDDASVYSEASTISTLSADDRQLNDEEGTPVQSEDEDEADKRLNKALRDMKLRD